MLIQSVIFWRTEQAKKQGKGERGVMFNNDELIIDASAKPVTAPVWDYRIEGGVLTVNAPTTQVVPY
jgi:hypothetical protein